MPGNTSKRYTSVTSEPKEILADRGQSSECAHWQKQAHFE